MDDSREFNDLYLPDLLRYVVAVTQNPDELGSGVLVNVQGRHFVATAAHCINKKNPGVLFCASPVNLTTCVETRPLRIIQRGWHESLDIGYLEIQNPACAELTWDQLSPAKVLSGPLHIVGYPAAHVAIDFGRREITLAQGAFQTSLIEQTADYLKLNYPKEGAKYDGTSGEWVPGLFPPSPKGYSGGACFGVAKHTTVGGVEQIRYLLFGIQSCWLESERYVKAIPIKHWCDLLQAHGLYRESQGQG